MSSFELPLSDPKEVLRLRQDIARWPDLGLDRCVEWSEAEALIDMGVQKERFWIGYYAYIFMEHDEEAEKLLDILRACVGGGAEEDQKMLRGKRRRVC